MYKELNGKIFVDSYDILPFYFEEYSESPGGFSWGYKGSGPRQLSYAILRHYTNDPEFARNNLEDFLHQVIARFDKDINFILTDETVEKFIKGRKELQETKDIEKEFVKQLVETGEITFHNNSHIRMDNQGKYIYKEISNDGNYNLPPRFIQRFEVRRLINHAAISIKNSRNKNKELDYWKEVLKR